MPGGSGGSRRVLVVGGGEGMPSVEAVPIGLPLADGLTPVVALVPVPGAAPGELDAFATRHRFVPRGMTARAQDSRARWTVECDGRVVFSFHAEEGSARFEIPDSVSIRAWVAFALAAGGTVGVLALPDMPSSTAADIGRRFGPNGGPYWLLSAGYITP